MNAEPISTRAETAGSRAPQPPKAALFQFIETHLGELKTGVLLLLSKSRRVDRTVLEDTADEILALTLSRAAEIGDRYDPDQSAYSWLLGIANNTILEFFRKERKHGDLIGDSRPETSTEGETGYAFLSEEEQLELILTGKKRPALSRLDDRPATFEELMDLVDEPVRILLRMAYVNQMDGNDIGAALNISRGYALVKLGRARVKFAKAYAFRMTRGEL